MRFFVHSSYELNTKAEWLGWPVRARGSELGWSVSIPGHRALLGGDFTCDLPLPGMMAQPHHCHAERTPSGRLFVEALSGYLIVNYRAVGRALLGPDDVLYVGRAKLELDPPRERTRAARASDPETHLGELVELASEFPREVMANPVFPLLFLEDPRLPARFSPSALCQFLQHEGSDEALWSFASNHERPLFRSFAARSPWVTPALLARLAHDIEPRVRAYAAQNPRAPSPILSRLAVEGSYEVRAGVARNPSTPPEVLHQLAYGAELLRAHVACNPSTAPDTLAALSDDESDAVRRGVARNPSAPLALTERLLSDVDGVVQWHAAYRLRAALSSPPLVSEPDDQPTPDTQESLPTV